MTTKIPNIVLHRDGTNNVITVLNFEDGDEWNLRRGDDYISDLTLVVEGHNQATYTDTGRDLQKSYIYRASFKNASISDSFIIIADHSDEVPPYYVAEPGTGVTFTDVTYTTPVSWGPDLTDLPYIQVDGIITEGELAGPRIAIGQHHTL